MQTKSTRFPFLPRLLRTKYGYDQLDVSAHEHPKPSAPRRLSKLLYIFRSAGDKAADICRTTGKLEELKAVVRRSQFFGTWTNTPNSSGDAPIHEAAYSGFLDIIKYLVEDIGVDINATTPGGHTALCLACMGGHVEATKYLLRAGASVTLTTIGDDASALHWAGYCGHTECVRVLLKFAQNLEPPPPELSLVCPTSSGFTPLLLASCAGHVSVVRLMVEEFLMDVNFVNEDGDTALHYACFMGCGSVVSLLLSELKASLNVKDKAGYTPLHLAAARGHDKIIRLLLNASTDSSDRHMLMCCSVVPCGVSPLPSAYNDCLLSKDCTGCLPLHLACEGGHLDSVRMLLGLSVVSTKTDAVLKTNSAVEVESNVLEDADSGGRGRESDVLGRLGLNYVHAMTMVTDKDGNTCVHTAVSCNRVRVASMLLGECKVDVNCRNSKGYTPLLLAAWKGHFEMAVRLIQNHAADKFAFTEQGEYGLHLACIGGHERLVQIVHYLLQCGDGMAREETDHAEGRTPLMVAAAYGQLHLVRFLVEKTMVDILRRDKKGRTCLHWAVRNDHADIASYLLLAAEAQSSAAELLWQQDVEGLVAADMSAKGSAHFILTEKAVKYPSKNIESCNLMHLQTLGNTADY